MSRSRKKGKGGLIALIIVLAIVITAIFTKPSYADHQLAVRQALVECCNESMQDNGLNNPLVSMIGGYVIDKIADTVVCSNMQYHDYVLFSTTTLNTPKGEKTLSLGIFGKVFTFDKEDLTEAIKEQFK